MTSKYLCAVPLIEAFINNNGGFRNCCVAKPQTESDYTTDFNDWWNGRVLNDFRESLKHPQLPHACRSCETREKINGRSFRTVINETVDLENLTLGTPSRWHIMFGNTCNLACWICNPKFSSVIENHKKRLGLIKEDYISPQKTFDSKWPTLKNDILKSYDEHETISITIGGGEPFYNTDVYNFLILLKEKNLSHRTKLEFNTNATQYNSKLADVLENTEWNSICIYLSIDAIGKKAEWLRYGCKWDVIESNIPHYKKIASYIEVHSSVCVLNIMDLPELQKFCNTSELKLRINPIVTPDFMALIHWDHDPSDLVSRHALENNGLSEFYDLIGKDPIIGSKEKLKNYITKFDGVRKHLQMYDESLSKLLGLS